MIPCNFLAPALAGERAGVRGRQSQTLSSRICIAVDAKDRPEHTASAPPHPDPLPHMRGGEGSRWENAMVTEDRKSKRKSRALNRSRAREMRHNPVSMEDAFWEEVRNRKLGGFKFKRQYLIDPYIADFVCLERHLVIELDGKLHEDRKGYDAARDAFLRKQGFDIYRIKNEDLAHNFAAVMSSILHDLTAPSPQPSPPLREGEGESWHLPSPPRSGGEGRVRGR